MNKTALVAGSTGLVGKQLLSLLLASDRYHSVIALTRVPLGIYHSRLVEINTTLDTLEQVADQMKCDDVFCCLGTTMAKAGSKEKFYAVDFEYPLKVARIAISQGARQYLLVSALGADKNSSIFYNRVKGEAEEALRQLGFSTLHIFRPSLLLGPRKEKRSGEDAAKWFYKVFGFLIPPRYKAVDASKVANAMLVQASRELEGVFIHESRELQAFKF